MLWPDEHPRSVERWVRAWNDHGVKGLSEQRRPGRRPRLDPASAPMFWDSRARSLEDQALLPIEALEEMRGGAYAEDVAIDSVVGKGTTVTVTLPADRVRAAPSEDAKPSASRA
mgnify:CR=1 FL=1